MFPLRVFLSRVFPAMTIEFTLTSLLSRIPLSRKCPDSPHSIQDSFAQIASAQPSILEKLSLSFLSQPEPKCEDLHDPVITLGSRTESTLTWRIHLDTLRIEKHNPQPDSHLPLLTSFRARSPMPDSSCRPESHKL